MKNGEIRVLRDSLRLANQEKDQQRQAQMALEREKAQAQSEREKELTKKVRVVLHDVVAVQDIVGHVQLTSDFSQVQSLQSDLHFKEAEMNEMRGKLKSSERGGKLAGTPVRNK